MSSPRTPAPGGVALGRGRIDWDARGRVTITGPAGEAVAADGVAAALAALAVSGGALGPLLGCPSRAAHAPATTVEEPFAPGVDMSSWALIVGGTHIVKVPRQLGAADRGARLQRGIAERVPELVPAVMGTVERAETGSVVALVTARVPEAHDGWTWVVDALAEHLDSGADPDVPERLGRLIARLHRALADISNAEGRSTGAGKTPRPESGAAERGAALAAVDAVLTHGAGTDERPGAAERFAARADAMRELLAGMPDPTATPFALHGDLHVGQILRGAGGELVVIDFDGDPQHPGDDAVGDAAVDIAHLQVSLDLVGAIVAKRRGADHPRIADWCRTAQGRLVDAYLAEAAVDGRSLLDPTRLPGLRAAQLVRELGYARDFLPRWAYAPDWAIRHRYPADPEMEDPPWTPPASSPT